MSFAFIPGAALALPSPAMTPVVAWGFSIMAQAYYDYVQQVAYSDHCFLFGPLTSLFIASEVAAYLAYGHPLRAEYQVFLSSPLRLKQ